MTEWQLTLTILLPILALAGALAALYFLLLPKFLIRKIRSGGENLVFPDDYETLREKVHIRTDIPYESDYPDSVYDLYRPICGEQKGLIVWAHGGFFIAGDKKGVANVCTALAADGFCVAAIDYAVAPENKYPDAVIQIDDFIAHALSEYPELCKKGIVVAGDSAGGQLAAQYAALVSSPALRAEMRYEPKIERGALKSVVLICAPIDVAALRGKHKILDFLLPTFGRAYFGKGRWYRSDRFRSARLFDYIDNNFPPCFLTDGNWISFEDQNKRLALLLQTKGVHIKTLFFDDEKFGKVNHEYLFDMKLKVSQLALSELRNFLNQTF